MALNPTCLLRLPAPGGVGKTMISWEGLFGPEVWPSSDQDRLQTQDSGKVMLINLISSFLISLLWSSRGWGPLRQDSRGGRRKKEGRQQGSRGPRASRTGSRRESDSRDRWAQAARALRLHKLPSSATCSYRQFIFLQKYICTFPFPVT